MEDNKTAEQIGTRNFDLTSFARAKEKMIATNEHAYQRHWDSVRDRMSKLRTTPLRKSLQSSLQVL
jgi:hypothetical protein